MTTAWAPHDWNTRQFAYFFGSAEANAMNMKTYFKTTRGYAAPVEGMASDADAHRTFRLSLAEQFQERARELRGHEPPQGRPRKRARRSNESDAAHMFLTRAPYTSSWNPHKLTWNPSRKEYQQSACKTRGCKKLVRTYCSCAPGVTLCHQCWTHHRLELASGSK